MAFCSLLAQTVFHTVVYVCSSEMWKEKKSKSFIMVYTKLVNAQNEQRPSWPWSYGSWIYNNLLNQCLSPLMLWVRISIVTRCTILCANVCPWLATGQWCSPGTSVSSTNKTDRHDITEILLKVVLSTIKQTNKQINKQYKMNSEKKTSEMWNEKQDRTRDRYTGSAIRTEIKSRASKAQSANIIIA